MCKIFVPCWKTSEFTVLPMHVFFFTHHPRSGVFFFICFQNPFKEHIEHQHR